MRQQQIIIPLCVAVLVAHVAGEKAAAAAEGKQEVKRVDDQEATDATSKTKRGLHHSLGDYGWHPSSGHHFGGYEHNPHGDHHFGGSDHHEHHEHHEHVKTITIEKKIPVPYHVTKHIPYTVEKKV